MKNLLLALGLLATASLYAQENKSIQQINVSGEGKVLVVPDEAVITIGVENTGNNAAEVKKKNDDAIDKAIQTIKKQGIAATDFQTQRVSLYKTYDYENKKNVYQASQSIRIHLKNLTKYDPLMLGLLESGVNTIQNVEFKSSKINELEAEARKKAMLNAKQKANDFVSVLEGQKVGKALIINDNSSTYYPTPIHLNSRASMAWSAESSMPKETMAIGEIEVVCTVSVSFALE